MNFARVEFYLYALCVRNRIDMEVERLIYLNKKEIIELVGKVLSGFDIEHKEVISDTLEKVIDTYEMINSVNSCEKCQYAHQCAVYIAMVATHDDVGMLSYICDDYTPTQFDELLKHTAREFGDK